MNKYGKCLAVETTGNFHSSENGATIIQSTCNPTEKEQVLKNDKQKYILCNHWNKCLSTPFTIIFPKIEKTFDVFHCDLNDIKNVRGLWTFHFGEITNIHLSTCLAFEENSGNHGERAIMNYCQITEKRQMWSFV